MIEQIIQFILSNPGPSALVLVFTLSLVYLGFQVRQWEKAIRNRNGGNHEQ